MALSLMYRLHLINYKSNDLFEIMKDHTDKT